MLFEHPEKLLSIDGHIRHVVTHPCWWTCLLLPTAYQPNGQLPVSSSPVAITSEAYKNVWTGSEMSLHPGVCLGPGGKR
jgi:hypothetical protein